MIKVVKVKTTRSIKENWNWTGFYQIRNTVYLKRDKSAKGKEFPPWKIIEHKKNLSKPSTQFEELFEKTSVNIKKQQKFGPGTIIENSKYTVVLQLLGASFSS